MNPTEFDTIEELESDGYISLQSRLDKGWRLIAVRVERPHPNRDGSFEEKFVYLIGIKNQGSQ